MAVADAFLGVAVLAGIAVYLLTPVVAGLGAVLGAFSCWLAARQTGPRQALGSGLLAGVVVGAAVTPVGVAWLGGMPVYMGFDPWLLAAATAVAGSLLGGLYLWWSAWMEQERDPSPAP